MDKALIDTSILLEPFVEWKNNEPNYKRSALALLRDEFFSINKKFKPVTSISIMGELSLVTNKKISLLHTLKNKREKMVEILDSFFSRCDIVGIARETIQLCEEILLLDERLDPLDALHIATAIIEKCQTFIFIDYQLTDNSLLIKFCKEKGLSLVNFGIKENMDAKRLNKDLRWLE